MLSVVVFTRGAVSEQDWLQEYLEVNSEDSGPKPSSSSSPFSSSAFIMAAPLWCRGFCRRNTLVTVSLMLLACGLLYYNLEGHKSIQSQFRTNPNRYGPDHIMNQVSDGEETDFTKDGATLHFADTDTADAEYDFTEDDDDERVDNDDYQLLPEDEVEIDSVNLVNEDNEDVQEEYEGVISERPLFADPGGDAAHVQLDLAKPFTKRRPDGEYHSLLEVEPPKFLPNYRNPCWMERIGSGSPYKGNIHYDREPFRDVFDEMETLWARRLGKGKDWRLRCLPYFYVAGVAKCGTSEIYTRIAMHPEVAKGPWKEPHFWAKWRAGWIKRVGPLPISNYIDWYDKASEELRRRTVQLKNGTYYHPMVFGDGSVSTLYYNDWWRNLPENAGRQPSEGPKYHVPHYLLHVQPQARIIVTLRNPTDRLYSDYLFFGRERKSASLFHKAVVKAIQGMEQCINRRSLWDCITDRTLYEKKDPVWKFQFHIRDGFYHVFIEEWFKLMPKEQMYIVRLEDYAQNRLQELDKIYQFLGLDPLPDEAVEKIINYAGLRNNQQSKKDKYGNMLDKTRELLDDYYRPYNQQLANLLGDNKYLWQD